MLRFDPTRAEHTKFIEPKGKKRPKIKNTDEPASKRSKTAENAMNHEDEDAIPVSMEHFHEIRGDLKKSLGSGGFSLLSMFNRPSDTDPNDESKTSKDKLYEEKQINKNNVKFLADFDPFKYDSSGDEADDGKSRPSGTAQDNLSRENGLQLESFFILNSTDARLIGNSTKETISSAVLNLICVFQREYHCLHHRRTQPKMKMPMAMMTLSAKS